MHKGLFECLGSIVNSSVGRIVDYPNVKADTQNMKNAFCIFHVLRVSLYMGVVNFVGAGKGLCRHFVGYTHAATN